MTTNLVVRVIAAIGSLALPILLIILALAVGTTPTATEQRHSMPITFPVPPPVGPVAGNPDPAEDDGGWDCRKHGNGVCGPANAQGAEPGCYVRTGKRAATLLTRWDERMAQELFTGVYRPSRCGRLTARDKAMGQRLGGTGQLCAGDPGHPVCWHADQARPKAADGPAWVPSHV